MISADNTCIRCGAWRVDARDEEAELLELEQLRELKRRVDALLETVRPMEGATGRYGTAVSAVAMHVVDVLTGGEPRV